MKISLHQVEPDSPIEDLTGHQKLFNDAVNFQLENDEAAMDNKYLDFSPSRSKNRWKMIYNSIFQKNYDKRILMKRYIEKQRRKVFRTSQAELSSPSKKKKVTIKREASSPVATPFVRKETLPRHWGAYKEIGQLEPEDFERSKALKKLSKMKQQVETLRDQLKHNEVNEIKRVIREAENKKRSARSLYTFKAVSKVKADIHGINNGVEARNLKYNGKVDQFICRISTEGIF